VNKTQIFIRETSLDMKKYDDSTRTSWPLFGIPLRVFGERKVGGVRCLVQQPAAAATAVVINHIGHWRWWKFVCFLLCFDGISLLITMKLAQAKRLDRQRQL